MSKVRELSGQGYQLGVKVGCLGRRSSKSRRDSLGCESLCRVNLNDRFPNFPYVFRSKTLDF